MVARDLIELIQIEQLRKIVEMKHRFIPAVLAEECHILAEIHVL